MLEASTDTIAGIVTLLATKDAKTVTFKTTTSSFFALAVQADDGIAVQSGVATYNGIMHMDGDIDNSSDTLDTVSFTDYRTIKAKSILTLESTTSDMVNAGSLSLVAGSGIQLHSSLTGSV